MDIADSRSFERAALLREQFGKDVPGPDLKTSTEGDGAPLPQDQLGDGTLPAADAARLAFADQLAALAVWIVRHPEWPVPGIVYATSQTNAEQVAELVAAGHEPMPLLGGVSAVVKLDAAPGPTSVALYAMPFRGDDE